MQQKTQIDADYSADFYSWTQNQSKLLRTLAKLGAELPTGLDLDQVAEEIEGLGNSDLNSVKSFVRQIFVHLIKASSDPKGQAVPHWRTEAATFHAEISDRYSPSMQQQIDMQPLWNKARQLAQLNLQEHGRTVAATVPAQCPYSLDELVADDLGFDAAIERLVRRE